LAEWLSLHHATRLVAVGKWTRVPQCLIPRVPSELIMARVKLNQIAIGAPELVTIVDKHCAVTSLVGDDNRAVFTSASSPCCLRARPPEIEDYPRLLGCCRDFALSRCTVHVLIVWRHNRKTLSTLTFLVRR
jgi:hypothetical protein